MGQGDQELLLAAWEAHQGRCAQHHGPREECADEERDWFPHRIVCRPAMELAAANTRYDELHKARPYHEGSFRDFVAEPSRSHPYHYRAGVVITVEPTDLSPDDDFLRQGAPQRPSDDDGRHGSDGQ